MASRDSQKRKQKKMAERKQRGTARGKVARFESIHRFLKERGVRPASVSPSELGRSLLKICLESQEDCAEAAALLEESFPNREETLVARATTHGRENRVGQSRQAYLELIERWPDSVFASEARELVEKIEGALREQGYSDFELLAAQECIEFAMFNNQDFGKAEALIASSLPRWPEDLRIINHFAVLRLLQGRPREGLELLQEAMERLPYDLFTTVHCVRFLLMLGRKEEARRLGELLKIDATPPEHYGKLQEGLALLGRDSEILRVFELGKESDPESTEFNHFAAVVLAHQGSWDKAMGLWLEATNDEIDDELALENLENAQLPEERRWPAWALNWQTWLTAQQCALLEESEELPNDLLARDSDLRTAVQNVLERSCPVGVSSALAFLSLQPTGLAGGMLRSFADGSWGPAYLRAEVADLLARQN